MCPAEIHGKPQQQTNLEEQEQHVETVNSSEDVGEQEQLQEEEGPDDIEGM